MRRREAGGDINLLKRKEVARLCEEKIMKMKSFPPTFVSFPRQRSLRVLLLSLVLYNAFLEHEAAAAATASRYFADLDVQHHSDFSPPSQHVPEDDQATEHAVKSALPGNADATEHLSSPLHKYFQSFAGAKSRFLGSDESPAAARHATQTSKREVSTVHGRSDVPRHRPLLSSGKYYTTHGRLREPDPSRAFHAEGNHANEPTHLHDDTRNAVSKHASKLGKMNQGGQFFASGHPSGSWQGSKNDLTHDNMQTSGDENSQYGPAQQETGEQTGPSSHLQPSSDQSDYQSHKDHEYIDGQPKLSAQNRDRADPSSQATEDNSEDTPDEGAEAFAEENTGMAGKNAEATDTKTETAVKSSRNTLTGQGQENSLDGQPKLSAQNRDRADASSQATEDNSEDTPDEVAEAFAEENTAIDDTNAEDTGDKMKSTRSKSTGQETYVRSSENGMKESRALDSAQTDDGTDREGLMKIIGMLIKSEEAMKSLSNMLSSKQENLDCSTTAEECVDNDQPSEDLAASSVPEDSPGDRQQNLRIQEEKVPDAARSSVEDASNPISPTVSDELDVIGIDPVSQDANKEKFDSPSMPTTSVVEVDEEHLQKDSTAFGQQDSATHVDDEENPALGSDSSETLQTKNADKSHSSASVSTKVEGDNKQEDIVPQAKDIVPNVLKGLAVSPTADFGPEDEIAPFFPSSHTQRMTSLTASDVPSAVTDAAVAGKSFSTRSYLVSPAGGDDRQSVSFASYVNGISDKDWMSAEPSLHAEREVGERSDVYYGQLTRFRRSSDARQQQETADVAYRFHQIAYADDEDFYYYDNDGADLSAPDVTNSNIKFLEDKVVGPAQQLVTGRTDVFWPQRTSQDPVSITRLKDTTQGDSTSVQLGNEGFLTQVEMPTTNKNGSGISNNLQSNSKPTDISIAA